MSDTAFDSELMELAHVNYLIRATLEELTLIVNSVRCEEVREFLVRHDYAVEVTFEGKTAKVKATRAIPDRLPPAATYAEIPGFQQGQYRLALVELAVKAGALTINEIRGLMGFPSLEGTMGRSYPNRL